MDCPKCKTPNPPEATYCNMCYEKFLHSAADAYIRTMRRARMKRGDAPSNEPSSSGGSRSKSPQPTFADIARQIPWKDIRDGSQSFLRRFSKVFLYIGIFVLVVLGIRAAMDPQVRASLMGSRITYVANHPPASYLFGFQSEVTVRGDRQTGDLYSPVDAFQINELTNVDFKGGRFSIPSLMLSVLRNNRSQNTMIPDGHPTTAPTGIQINAKGVLTQRDKSAASRTNRAGLFIAPTFPGRRLKPGQTWKEPVAWIDMLGDWRIRWSGSRQWKMEEMLPCGDSSCARLSYSADIQPQVFSHPAWMKTGKTLVTVSVERGSVLFDVRRHLIHSHTFAYDATLRLFMDDLARIPSSKRVGRRVFHTPGSLVLELQNKIAVTKKSISSET